VGASCPICEHSAGNRVHVVREMMLGCGDQFEYGECLGCQCLWLISPPSDMGRYYPADYQAGRTNPLHGFRRVAAQLRNRYALERRGLAGRILEARRPNLRLRALSGLGIARSARILDVGCGDGALVEDLRALGYELSHGIDPVRVSFEGGNRRPFVERKTIDEIGGTWDAVMFQHSFEHMANPAGVLLRVADLLSPGGVCVLRMPVVPCYAWQEYGVNWVQLDAPRHLFIHSRESLGRLASAAGLETVRAYCDSCAFQFWGSERYRSGQVLRRQRDERPGSARSSLSKSRFREYARRAELLNCMGQGDQAVFIVSHASGRVRPN
jgi:SAM-dependent methyltransferase